MFTLDRTRENYGWIGADALDLVDPDFDALLFAVTLSGVDGGVFDAEMVSGQTVYSSLGAGSLQAEDGSTLTDEGATDDLEPENTGSQCTNDQSFAYGTSGLCTGAQYIGVDVGPLGYEDFGFRFRTFLDSHAGLRDVARWETGQLIVQVTAGGLWQVYDGSTHTSAEAASTGVWYDVAVEREGPDMALKIDGAVVLSWTSTLDLDAQQARVGTDNANGADAYYQDMRLYLKGNVAASGADPRGYRNRFARYIRGVGRL